VEELIAPQQPKTRKTTLCKFFEQGVCSKGGDCTYAHGVEELIAPQQPKAHKTRLCKFFEQGGCITGDDCTYAHRKDELIAGLTIAHWPLPPPGLDELVAAEGWAANEAVRGDMQRPVPSEDLGERAADSANATAALVANGAARGEMRRPVPPEDLGMCAADAANVAAAQAANGAARGDMQQPVPLEDLGECAADAANEAAAANGAARGDVQPSVPLGKRVSAVADEAAAQAAADLGHIGAGDCSGEVPQSMPVASGWRLLEVVRSSMDYNAREMCDGGTTLEVGYLAVQVGQRVFPASAPVPGHASNRFRSYAWFFTEVCQGWCPLEALRPRTHV